MLLQATRTVGSGTAADPTRSTNNVQPAPKQQQPVTDGAFPAPEIAPRTEDALRKLAQDYLLTVLGSHTRLAPRGLVNTGNLCFMNSILQVFALPLGPQSG